MKSYAVNPGRAKMRLADRRGVGAAATAGRRPVYASRASPHVDSSDVDNCRQEKKLLVVE